MYHPHLISHIMAFLNLRLAITPLKQGLNRILLVKARLTEQLTLCHQVGLRLGKEPVVKAQPGLVGKQGQRRLILQYRRIMPVAAGSM